MNVVRCGLIYEVVDPVGIDQVRARTPFDDWCPGIVIIREVVIRYIRIQSRILIPNVFLQQRVPVVFRVAGYEDLTVVRGFYAEDPRFFGRCQHLQLRHRFDVLPVHGGIPRMRYIEFIVKAPEQHAVLLIQMMQVHAGQLLRQHVLLNTVMVVQSGLGTPADVERAVDVGFAPLHNLA